MVVVRRNKLVISVFMFSGEDLQLSESGSDSD